MENELKFEKVWRMFLEIAKQFQETEKKFQEIYDPTAKTHYVQKE